MLAIAMGTRSGCCPGLSDTREQLSSEVRGVSGLLYKVFESIKCRSVPFCIK